MQLTQRQQREARKVAQRRQTRLGRWFRARTRAVGLAWQRRPRKYQAEVLTALVWIAGWALITAGLVELLSAAGRIFGVPLAELALAIWLLSAGILAVGLGGWSTIVTVLRAGLYTLTRESEEAEP